MTQEEFEKNDLENIKKLFQSIELETNCSSMNIISTLYEDNLKVDINEHVETHYIGSKDDIQTWIDIASKAYNFTLNHQFFYSISKNKYIDFVLTYYDGIPIATALIICYKNRLNIHMISVLPEYKNKGIKNSIIQEIVAYSKRENSSHLILQTGIRISDIESKFL